MLINKQLLQLSCQLQQNNNNKPNRNMYMLSSHSEMCYVIVASQYTQEDHSVVLIPSDPHLVIHVHTTVSLTHARTIKVCVHLLFLLEGFYLEQHRNFQGGRMQ